VLQWIVTLRVRRLGVLVGMVVARPVARTP